MIGWSIASGFRGIGVWLMRMPAPRTKWLVLASFAAVALLVFSGWNPYDRATWLMDVSRLHDRALQRLQVFG
jgi:hypothetical protein